MSVSLETFPECPTDEHEDVGRRQTVKENSVMIHSSVDAPTSKAIIYW